jgi:hypothetical protein
MNYLIENVLVIFQFASVLSPIHDKTNIFKIENSTVPSSGSQACVCGEGCQRMSKQKKSSHSALK